ncbi:transposase [Streptomyces sp. NPDC013457]|uniref:transposase n=1 Tax=Streptomyces sp. NPDC013457 TaxID=3364866 RepID=UPI0036F9206E
MSDEQSRAREESLGRAFTGASRVECGPVHIEAARLACRSPGRAQRPEYLHHRRVLLAVCPGGLANLLGYAPIGVESLALDGKSARGSRILDVPAAHLLSAVTGAGHTVSQLRVPDRTNEITGFARLLAPFDLAGTVVTADALHTQREHARFLVEEKYAHHLFGSRPTSVVCPPHCGPCHGTRSPPGATTASADTAAARPARPGC